MAALGAAMVVLADRRSLLVAGFAMLAAAESALLLSLGEDVGLETPTRPALLALLVPSLAVLGAAGIALARYPSVIPVLVLVAAPFRLPLDVDPDKRFFFSVAESGSLGRLLPLYLVLSASVVGLLLRVARVRDVPVMAREVALPVAGFLSFSCLSLIWSGDPGAAAERLAFFVLPFAVLLAVVVRVPFAPWLPRVLAVAAVGMAALFAAIGIWQAATHKLLFFAPSVEIANTYSPIFRVTSLFRDPSLYGRHVILGIVVVLVALWLGRVGARLALPAITLLWAGLYVSYSQSSLAALFAAALLIAALSGSRRIRKIVALATAAIFLLGAVIVADNVRDESVRRATNDRSRRVELAARVFVDRPIAGVGLAAQPLATQALDERPAQLSRYVSHTTPLTIAAELGLIGLALYAALLAGTIRLVERVRRQHPALGLSLAGALVALFVHALFYSGFFEDPMTWVAIGLAASFVAERVQARSSERVLRTPAQEAVSEIG